jgi:MarR family transcriptional repressor of emrRAB
LTNAATDDARLGNLVAALSVALADRIRLATEAAADHGGAGPAALVALHEFLDGATVEQLRDAIGLTHSGAVRLVDRLVEDGLVERGAGRDRRSVGLRLTPVGRKAARRVQRARANALAPATGALSGAERVTLTRLVEKMLAGITEDKLRSRAEDDSSLDAGWLCRLCDPRACGRPDGRCPTANAAQRAIRASGS